MRPMSTEAALGGRPRKLSGPLEPPSSSLDDARDQPSSQSMTYFLADEATVAAAAAGGVASSSSASRSSSAAPNFGVRSLEASVEDSDLRWKAKKSNGARSSSAQSGRAPQHSPEKAVEDRDEVEHHENDGEEEDDKEEERDDGHEDDDDVASLHSLQSSLPSNTLLSSSPRQIPSEPLSPILGPASEMPSTPRSGANLYEQKLEEPKSFEKRPDDARRESDAMASSMNMQLIMPEITMPSRRPFTAKGKQIGRLKVLIAGDSGIGKTSLIKSIVQTCDDIVHVDPISLPQQNGSPFKYGPSSFANLRRTDDSTKQITEVLASTRPYPHWWSEIDENRVLRRRKSRMGMDEPVIERNLCFVDTPGYGSGTSFLECIEPVVKYVESQFERTQSVLTGEGDYLSVISGNGVSQVDVVFYVILHRLKPVDVEFIRRLSPYTSVLPVIAKADTLTPQQITSLKLSILGDLRAAGIKPFLFGNTPAEILRRHSHTGVIPSTAEENPPAPFAPFAVSSVVASDSENMDASVLMSPEYIPPLVDTELKDLVQSVFEPDNIAWLRHAAAKKYMHWKSTMTSSTTLAHPRGLLSRPTTPIQRRAGSPGLLAHSSTSLVPLSANLMIAGSSGAADSFALAKVADHTQREERMAKVRLSRWAHDLQRSLQAERERYERLARGDRAVWLTERLSETIAEGQLVPISSLPPAARAAATAVVVAGENRGVDARDPLGVLRLNEALRRKVVSMVKLAGIGGVIGVVSVLVLQRWGLAGLEEWLPQLHSME